STTPPTVTVPVPAAAPASPAPSEPAPSEPAPSAPASPPTGTTVKPSEPVELQASVRHSMASEGASLLKVSAPVEEDNPAGKVVAELEHCLQLIADSSLPSGLEPAGCGIGG
ncbi:MAG TPA: hypothetical protein VEJ23_09070, partial [Solirubrobacteraceae bacterium]|nr:hypothetical protein [Solirubrobacteraceae bacterium]